ncbi:MAG: histidine kinase [Fulvivirga sp.]|uniref:sensor histidine kinase n=1 Tax=Fulvivirga sp. TaxID=1931237 RepID=UPI0032EB7A57
MKPFKIIGIIWSGTKLISIFSVMLWLKSIGVERSIIRVASSQIGSWLLGLVFLYFIINLLLKKDLLRKYWGYHLRINLLGIVVFTLLMSVFPILMEYLYNKPELPELWEMYLTNLPSFFRESFLTYNFLIGITYGLIYYDSRKQEEVKREKVEKQLLETRMLYLKSQLRPHFLFNSLNAISSLIDEDSKKAQSMLVDLSELLRSVLEFDSRNKITLQEELNILEKYIQIETTRFSDSLIIKKNISNDHLTCLIPSFILQPLVENSIKHGFTENRLEIVISTESRNGTLCIKVSDNGAGLADNWEYGTGLSNIITRIGETYGEKYSFEIYNNGNQPGLTNEITLPIEK